MDHVILRIDVDDKRIDDLYVLPYLVFVEESLLNFILPSLVLLAYRIWSVDRTSARLCGHRKSQLRPLLHIIIDAGVIYSVTLLAALICFVNKSNGQYVILDTVSTPRPCPLTRIVPLKF